MRPLILPALLAAHLGLFAASAVAAEPSPERETVRVSVADLDLRTTADARVALARIQRAAAKICGEEPDSRNLERQALLRACTQNVTGEAVAAAHSPVLAAAMHGGPAASATRVAAN